MDRIIGHIDMDAFFASVEERDKPYLKGLPVIVGSDPEEGDGRGVVSTANYKARELGIHSALPIQKAWRLCEESRTEGGARCAFVSPRMSKYQDVSKEVFALVKEYVPIISQTSVDEAYLDLTSCGSFKKAKETAERIKEAIHEKIHLRCSIGIGPNKMIAKIASDYEKPNGLTVVDAKSVEKFLAPLPIRVIPGIGEKTSKILLQFGAKTVRDVQTLSWEELQKKLGKNGFSLWERVRGIDERPVETEEPKRKSIGKHYTFSEDTHNMEEVIKVLKSQIQSILKQMRVKGFTEFRTVVLTVRFQDFVTVTRSLTVDIPIHSVKEFELKMIKLVLPFFEKTENPKKKAIRLIGVRVEKLV